MPTASGSATCLGIDVAAQYLPIFSDCRRERMWSLKYEPDDPSHPQLPRLDHRRRWLHLDLMSVQSAALAGEAHERFDLVVMQETFEHIRFPYRAAAALYHLLRPGGLVLWSKPSFGLEPWPITSCSTNSRLRAPVNRDSRALLYARPPHSRRMLGLELERRTGR